MKSKTSSAVIFFLMFGAIWTSVVGVFDVILAYGVVNQMRAESYPTTTGTITSSEIKSFHDSDGTTYGAAIEYTYEVNGLKFQSDRLRYGGFTSSSDHSEAADQVAAHPVNFQTTVHYNPDDPSDSVLEVGVGGQDYFLALFLTPFNVVMLFVWGYLLGALRRWITKPPAGGVPIVTRRNATHLRMPRFSPFLIAGAAALAVSFVSIFVVGYTSGFNPPFSVIGIIWAVVLGSAGILYLKQKIAIGSGAKDLVIDHVNNVLSLPQTFGRKEDVLVAVEYVEKIKVDRVTHHGEGSTSYTYAPTLYWKNENSESQSDKLADWHNENRANEFVEWLREKIRIA